MKPLISLLKNPLHKLIASSLFSATLIKPAFFLLPIAIWDLIIAGNVKFETFSFKLSSFLITILLASGIPNFSKISLLSYSNKRMGYTSLISLKIESMEYLVK